jgi:hypothetical protein
LGIVKGTISTTAAWLAPSQMPKMWPEEAENARLKDLFKGLQKTNDQVVAARLALDAELQTKNATIEQLENEKEECISQHKISRASLTCPC